MVLCATRDTINESLLYCCVQILVLHHLGQPPLLQQASEHHQSSGVLGSFIAGRVVGLVLQLLTWVVLYQVDW